MRTLYSYFRSSAAYRVRIALNLKGLAFDTIPVHLLAGGEIQHTPAYAQINPTHLVPTLVEDEIVLGQSMAIIEYLDETYPLPPLLPVDGIGRAKVRSISQLVACDIHPLNNLRVLQYLDHVLRVDTSARATWYRHWVTTGFEALERMLQASGDSTRLFCVGDAPGMADCCLVSQMYNARRFNVPMDSYPELCRIEAACLDLKAFQQAAPESQSDAE